MAEEEDEIPKWPIYAFIGVVFIGAPLMPQAKGGGAFGRVVSMVYNRVGATGLLVRCSGRTFTRVTKIYWMAFVSRWRRPFLLSR